MATDLCAECGESLWGPSRANPEVLHRFVHRHTGKKTEKIIRFLPALPELANQDDDTSKDLGRITPSQERAIVMALGEIGASNGSLIGDEPGFGKTAIGAEFIIRSGYTRGLVIGLPNTHKQWADRIFAQSEGRIVARIMNGTAAGRENFEAFMKHEPGIYIAGSAYLMEKDWESEAQWKVVGDERVPVWKMDKKTGAPVLDDAGQPVQETKTVRQNRYARLHRKPLDFVIFDEVQAIANRKSKTRQTILSIKAHYRMGMSGTWFLNKIDNMWSVARWVWPGENPATGEPYVETSHDRWVKRFLEQEEQYVNGKRLETKSGTAIMKVLGEKVKGEFVSTLPAYIRREAEPVPTAERIFVDPTAAQRAQIQDFERDLMTWVMGWDGEEVPVVADIPIVLQTRLRQIAIAELSTGENEEVLMAPDAASAKLTPLRYLVEQHWANQPVLIYTDSKIGAHFIAQRMQRAGLDARAWTGDLSQGRREQLKEAFLAGEFRYLVVTVQSFGTGIDGFQHVANKVAWVSLPQGDPALEDQAIRRIWRPGMTQRDGGFQQVVLLMNESTDIQTMDVLLAKAWQVRTAMNGGEKAA